MVTHRFPVVAFSPMCPGSMSCSVVGWRVSTSLTTRPKTHCVTRTRSCAGHYPRYYQEAAINRAVAAVLQARRGLRAARLLLTLATGTGKTKIAFQIAWKLKRVRVVKNIMFLTDRDYLLTQAMDNEFAPFRDARARIRGVLKTAQDVFFTTYQALAGSESSTPLYKRYPKDYFDLIIVDECHRGSAQDDSNWRKILEYFDSAVQIGMTATPLRDDNIDTYSYFGRPLVVYSLRQGISDGYLAPYRVRRVLTDRVEEEEEEAETLAEGHEPEPPADKQEPVACESSDEADAEPAIRLESSAAMVARTDVIAAHLARKLRETDTRAKTIVFCVDQEHARLMLEALEREFPAEIESFKARGENYIERIVSDEGADGKRALGKFSDSEKDAPVIVTTSKLLSTGVDMPPCKNIVIARPIGSIVEFKQIIGRGTRLDEPHKMWFTIIDYAGTTKHFYDPEFDGDPQFIELDNLNDTNEWAPGEETGGEPPAQAASPGDSASTSSSADGVDTSPARVDPTSSPTAPNSTPGRRLAEPRTDSASPSDSSSKAHQQVKQPRLAAPDAAVPAEPRVPSSPVPNAVPTADDVQPPSTEPAPALPERHASGAEFDHWRGWRQHRQCRCDSVVWAGRLWPIGRAADSGHARASARLRGN